MVAKSSQGGHSAQVKMRLLVNGSSFPVVQMGPDFILVNEAVDHPPANARLVLQVDETEREWNIHLPNGISSGSKRVVISTPQ
jgi:hypothetical protein